MENSMIISGLMASNTGLNLDNPDTRVRVASEIASRIRTTGASTSGRVSCGRMSPERTSDACTSPASCADDIILLSIEKEKEREIREESAKQNFFRKVSYSDVKYLHFVKKVSHEFGWYLLNLIIARFYV